MISTSQSGEHYMLILFYLFIGLISSAIINILADTLPVKSYNFYPVCSGCGSRILWKDYLLGKNCPNCGHRHLIRFYIVALFSIALSVIWGLNPGLIKMPFGIGMVLYTYLALIVVIDMENRLILYSTCITGAVIALAFGIYYNGWQQTLIGGLAGFGAMLVLYLIGGVFGKWLSRKNQKDYDDALGFGDVNLAGISGLLVGWPAIAGGLMGAILAGGLCSLIILVMMLVRKDYQPMKAIPYAPFIVLATTVIMVMQEHI
jgi:prepilin signal peptidase PulO-like enzyme (type II secretory pathway)